MTVPVLNKFLRIAAYGKLFVTLSLITLNAILSPAQNPQLQTQSQRGIENESEKVFDFDLDRFINAADDLGEIGSNIRTLENYKKDQLELYSDCLNFKSRFLRTPKPIIENELKSGIQRVEKLIEDFHKTKSEEKYNVLQEEYNNLIRLNLVPAANTYGRRPGSGSENMNDELLMKFIDSIEEVFRVYLKSELPSNLFVHYYDDNDYLNGQSKSVDRFELYVTLIERNISSIQNADITSFNTENLKAYKSFDDNLTKLINDTKGLISKIDGVIAKLKEQKKALNRDINEWGIITGLPWFCATVIILFLITVFSKRISFINNGKDSNQDSQEHLSKVLLEVITVLLLTLTILILGLSNILKENVLGTLIGGIAGYILNRTRFQSKASPNTAPKQDS